MDSNPKQHPIPSPMPTQLSQSSTSLNGQGQASGLGAQMDPQNRRKRRMMEKMKAKENPPPNPNSKLLHQRVSGVEHALNRLADLSDQNARVFSDSLHMLESMGIIMQRVMNDMVANTVRCLGDTDTENGGMPLRAAGPILIDYQSYIQEYQLCLVMAGFAAWCASLQPKEETIIKATTQDVVVFGGG